MGSSRKQARKKQRQKEAARAQAPGWLASTRVRVVLAACALVALVAIAYGNSIGNGFVWDDHEQIAMNPDLRPTAPLTPFFTTDIRFAHQELTGQNHTYRPLQMLTYREVGGLFGFTPGPLHVCSVLLVMGGALAAFGVLLLLTRSAAIAFASAALFAVYPVHTEAVDWIAASPELGCGVFVLVSFGLLLAGRRGEPRPTGAERSSWWMLLLSLAAFAVALLWKETAVVLPVLVVLYVLVVERGRGSVLAALQASAGYWLVLALYLAVRIRVLGSFAAGQRVWDLTMGQFLLTALHLMLSYWEKLVFPFGLNAYYLFTPVRSITDPRAMEGIAFALVVIAGAVYLVRKAPLGAFAVLWVCITLLPVMDVYALGRDAFAERYLYLPSLGFCLGVALLAAALLRRIPQRFRMITGAVAAAAMVCIFAAETIERNPDWKDDKTLFAATLRQSPDAPFVRVMVATQQSNEEPGSADAEQNYLAAITLAKAQRPPDRVDLEEAYQGLGSLYSDRSDYPQALAMLSLAREAGPTAAELDSEEGLILARAGRWSEAEPLLERAYAKQPRNENLLSTLGLMAWQYQHDLPRAAEYFSQALAVHSEDDAFSASLHNNLGGVYAEQANYGAAIEQFRRAVAIWPSDPGYHTNLASALGATQQYGEARAEAEMALRIDPKDAGAQAVLEKIGGR